MYGYDYLVLGPNPHGEPCVQLNTLEYVEYSRLECEALIAQLHRMFPEINETEGIYLARKSFDHEFGRYVEVVVYYQEPDPLDDDAEPTPQLQLALKIEGNMPEFWDDEAKKWLAEKGYSLTPMEIVKDEPLKVVHKRKSA